MGNREKIPKLKLNSLFRNLEMFKVGYFQFTKN